MAVYYVLNFDQHVLTLGRWLAQYPKLTQAITSGVMVFEGLFPLLLFSPYYKAYIRMGLIGLFWLFHIALGASMVLGTFVLVCLAFWLLVLRVV